jgi:hypothetical protein
MMVIRRMETSAGELYVTLVPNLAPHAPLLLACPTSTTNTRVFKSPCNAYALLVLHQGIQFATVCARSRHLASSHCLRRSKRVVRLLGVDFAHHSRQHVPFPCTTWPGTAQRRFEVSATSTLARRRALWAWLQVGLHVLRAKSGGECLGGTKSST